MGSAFELLHDAVKKKLWDMRWVELRSIQSQAVRHLLGGGSDCIIASPTAGGKTEAAFLPVLSAIADDPMGGVRAMYIGPLKALINDQFGRLEELCARMEMPVHKWHGDVGESERKALVANPGGVMLITPESLEAMFVLRSGRISEIFSRLSFVVIDELHAFLGSPRGAQLRSLLHRLRTRAGCDPVRIGLSATIGNFDDALRWIRPDGSPATLIRDVGTSELKVAVRGIWRRQRNDDEPASDANSDDDPSIAELARTILVACRGTTNLLFANTKGQIEELADELVSQAKAFALPDEIVVHHGSLSKEQREYAEARLKEGRPCTAVCSNTLEMGIDIGQIDTVVQVAAPWSVTSLVQRLGRSGRKRGQARKLRAYFVEDEPAAGDDTWPRLHLEFLQGVAVVELMLERFVEPAEMARAQWSTLIQQVMSMLAETGGLTASMLKARILDSRAFASMSDRDFALLLRNLGKEDLIEQLADGSLVLGLKGQRIVEHYSFFAAFRTPVEFRVINGSAEIGMLPELTAPMPGDHVILAGRRWKVERVDPDRREILVVPSQGRKRPKFTSLGADVHAAVHEKMRSLLGSDVRPSYLDDVALEILADARRTAAPFKNFQPALVPVGGRVTLFLWKGSKVQRTLLLVLVGAGIRVRDEEVALDADASMEDVIRALAAFASAPDGDKLAGVAEEQLHARLLGGDKFDRYLPSSLWRRCFAADQLDLAGGLQVVREILALGDVAKLPPPSRAQPLDVVAQNTIELRPLVGLWLSGSSLIEEDMVPGRGTVGTPRWGPADLLRDLELRLGLPTPTAPDVRRTQAWAARMETHSDEAFYARSLTVDRLGTARAVLSLRDQLVEAGWTGESIPLGGARLDLICRLEAETHPTLPAATPDRLVRVEGALAGPGTSPYRQLLLVEDRSLWSERWRRIFAKLESRGTDVRVLRDELALPIANDDPTDLALLQSLLAGRDLHSHRDGGTRLRGDGSLVFLRADTSFEAAEAVAALLRASAGEDVAVIREAGMSTLDGALARQRIATMGTRLNSRWRPLSQVLRIAVELMFKPRDPVRLIELLTLPEGPFHGEVGWSLASALAQEPGIGGRRWRETIAYFEREGSAADSEVVANRSGNERIERIQRQLERIRNWIECPIYPIGGAPKAFVLEVIGRVRAWLQARLTAGGERAEELAMALHEAETVFEGIADTRDPVPREVIRQILGEAFGGGGQHEVWPESAGRPEHVLAPAGLRRDVAVLIWWQFVDGPSARVPNPPWRISERSALRSMGIILSDPSALFGEKCSSWRRAVLHARRRLYLVVPERDEGEMTANHPFMDEIAAAMQVETRDLSAVTLHARDLLSGAVGETGGLPRPGIDRLEPLPLPRAALEWRVRPSVLALPERMSATSLEAMLGCPLKWALTYRARLRPAPVAEVPSPEKLAGQLGHRLIEELYGASATDTTTVQGSSTASDRLERLIEEEAALLLRPGMSFERAQLRRDLLRTADGLRQFFEKSGYAVVASEKADVIPWQGTNLHGRIDLLLAREREELVVDLKFGYTRYRDLLRDGLAVQLATYAFIRSQVRGGPPPSTGYYSITRNVFLTTDARLRSVATVVDGAVPSEVWNRVDASITAVRGVLAEGRLPVTGVRDAPPLLPIGTEEPSRFVLLEQESACKYCNFGPICGRAWQGVARGR